MNDIIDRLLEATSIDEESIKIDSRKIENKDTFIAIKGTFCDGHDYIHQALERGAEHIICEHEPSGLSNEDRKKIIITSDTSAALGYISRHIFKNPSETLPVYGVTGTNGKTTTVFLIDSILNNSGRPSGLIGTVFTKTLEDVLNPSSMTTPDTITLNRLLSEMVSSGKQAAAIEISSHALRQKRAWGIGLQSAVFTNITPEHLDYHKDMETYLKDKAMIFQSLKPDGVGVINVDDPLVKGLKDTVSFPRLVTFGIENSADVSAENIHLSADGLEFNLVTKELGSAHIRTSFIGKHNVYNMLAAVGALLFSGLDLNDIKKGLENAAHAPGRLEAVDTAAPFKVFIDYAHTPDALKKALLCLRPLTLGKLISVFGCGGDRDKTKRPVMGKIASEICDYFVLTNDNPRMEDPGEILKQIEKGVSGKNNYCIIDSRRGAIQKALEQAREGDIVLIAGKGHEACQIIGETPTHFNDKEVVNEILTGMTG